MIHELWLLFSNQDSLSLSLSLKQTDQKNKNKKTPLFYTFLFQYH